MKFHSQTFDGRISWGEFFISHSKEMSNFGIDEPCVYGRLDMRNNTFHRVGSSAYALSLYLHPHLTLSCSADEGGATRMSGGIPFLTLPAGYLGSSFIGAVLIACGFDTNASKVASLVLAGFFLFTLWWARRNLLYDANPINVSNRLSFCLISAHGFSFWESLVLSYCFGLSRVVKSSGSWWVSFGKPLNMWFYAASTYRSCSLAWCLAYTWYGM